jgi:uncharacterized membrane protein
MGTNIKTAHTIRLSQLFFAITMIGLGIIGMIKSDFTPTWSGVYKSIPARTALAWACAIVSIVSGLGLLLRITVVLASRLLLFSLLLWLLVFRASYIFMHPLGLEGWWALGDTCVMIAAAWVIQAMFADSHKTRQFRYLVGENGMRTGRVLYGIGLIPFGIAHFYYLKRSLEVVPGWAPWHLFWVYATGCLFIATGVAIIAGFYGRIAAFLSALQMGLFTVIVWIPILVSHPGPYDWVEFYNSWALTAAGWVVADSYRRSRFRNHNS